MSSNFLSIHKLQIKFLLSFGQATHPMADPGFPRGGANPGEGHQPNIWPIFPKIA